MLARPPIGETMEVSASAQAEAERKRRTCQEGLTLMVLAC